MGAELLLNALAELFLAERKNGLNIDRIGLALAYEGLVGESYILGVSAPSLSTEYDCADKADTIIDLLFIKLPAEQRSMIDRVRVYDSAKEFERHARCNFDESYYGYCEAPFASTSQTKVLA